MSKRTYCPLCKEEADVLTTDVHMEAYEYLMKMIKQNHPEWVKKDGACPECIEYYKKL